MGSGRKFSSESASVANGPAPAFLPELFVFACITSSRTQLALSSTGSPVYAGSLSSVNR